MASLDAVKSLSGRHKQGELLDLCTSWKCGALLSGVVAHGDDVLEDDVLLVHQGAHELALLRGHVHLTTTQVNR